MYTHFFYKQLVYRPILHCRVGPLVAFLTNGFSVKFAMAFAINAFFSPSIRLVKKNHFNNFQSIGKYTSCKIIRIFEALIYKFEAILH